MAELDKATMDDTAQLSFEENALFIQTDGSLTFAADWAAIASLNKKMANVMGRLKAVQEDAKHQQGWKYASYSAVVELLRKALSEEGVGLYANLIRYEQHPQGKGIKSTVEVEFTFADGETGALRTSRWAGEAMDFGVADKGLNKAYTAAEKYFLMRTFLVSTSDDVEPDATSKPKTARKAPPKAKAQERKPIEPKPTSVDTTRPYRPEIVQEGILSRASKGDQATASDGLRGVVIGCIEGIWATEMPDIREAKRHAVLNFLFGDPSSKSLTKARCDAILQWLTETVDGKRVLNAFATAEAIAMVPSSDDLPFLPFGILRDM